VVVLITTSVAVAHIYREDPPRVVASRNRLGLSLSKYIRHMLVTKIKDKRKPRTYEALGWILTDYSCAHHAPTPLPRLTSPRYARSGEKEAVNLQGFGTDFGGLFTCTSCVHAHRLAW
jgi:hypothetical protein